MREIKELKDLYIKVKDTEHFRKCYEIDRNNFYDEDLDYVSLTTSLVNHIGNEDIEDLRWLCRQELNLHDIEEAIRTKDKVYQYDYKTDKVTLIDANDLLDYTFRKILSLSFYEYRLFPWATEE